jgi:hypothetical protein
MYVNQISSTNYSEIPTMTVDMPFDEYVAQFDLEIISRDGDTAVVRAEWGNGEGYDEFQVTGIEA